MAGEFARIPGASEVIIFGSWAARHAGEAGATPHDIDVLVVGEGVARADVYEAADRAQARLGLPVNPTIRSRPNGPTPTIRSAPRSDPRQR